MFSYLYKILSKLNFFITAKNKISIPATETTNKKYGKKSEKILTFSIINP